MGISDKKELPPLITTYTEVNFKYASLFPKSDFTAVFIEENRVIIRFECAQGRTKENRLLDFLILKNEF